MVYLVEYFAGSEQFIVEPIYSYAPVVFGDIKTMLVGDKGECQSVYVVADTPGQAVDKADLLIPGRF